MAKKFVVTLKKGLSRCSHSQRATIAALGLRKRHQSVEVADNPANRGQVFKIQHLVDVEVKR
ncbi:MAG: 50S ribosomal protein L30 [Bdellovibrio sp. CG10_big_fil_rev_8_21_14_0_10_47_8]|nr:MAG: 50S ribosomal protein L30 [Bdellovibrio sp. CG10_big_fil_rev_8_21_14_0_10_47_8]